MANHEIVPKPLETRTRSNEQATTWLQAYIKFLMNGQENFGLKILPLVAMGLLPVALANDILLPFLGMADNIPMAILVMYTVVRTWARVKTYR